MRVILLEDLLHLGKKHEVKDVSDGYARNFLFPRNLAKPATEQALKALTLQKAREEREKSAEYQKYKVIGDKLKSLILTFKVKISAPKGRDLASKGGGGARGRAFGSVTAVKIRDALKKQKIEVEKEWILLEEPIKISGEKRVKIKLPHELIGELKVVVESENPKS